MKLHLFALAKQKTYSFSYLCCSCLLLSCCTFSTKAAAQDFHGSTIKGKVFSETTHQPLAKASVRVKGTDRIILTDGQGNFSLSSTSGEEIAIFSHLGYARREVRLTAGHKHPFIILLHPLNMHLQEVVVSTGYQTVPSERATGSFDFIDNKQLNNSVSTDILSRLEGNASGLVFNRNRGAQENSISIRGRSTLFADDQPLIVVDNFPYEGDINDINPNDVQSITILKDAAAASIWGARAGNGVIVITTKKGRFNTPLKVSFNANMTIGQRPDLFYNPVLSSQDFIEIEKTLFDKGFYKSQENSFSHPPLTPVVELLIAKRDGRITGAEADKQINALAKVDVRNDFEKYYYRKSFNQQYAVNMEGGSENDRFYLSLGYDNNRDNAVGNQYDRVTLNASNTYALLKHRLSVTANIHYTQSNVQDNNPGYSSVDMASGKPLYPYARIADEDGDPLPVAHDYRLSYAQSAPDTGLLNWEYLPLEELRLADNTTGSADYRLNLRADYRFSEAFHAELLYQYGKIASEGRDLKRAASYYARDLINQYTQVADDGSLSRPIPEGGILDMNYNTGTSWDWRGQVNFDKTWNKAHHVSAIAGTEAGELHSIGNAYRLYGYDDTHAISTPVDYTGTYDLYYNPYRSRSIPYADFSSDHTNRYLSYYMNASYTYKDRYTLSASGRLDQSNLFGVKTNQRGVPLWSSGISWNIAREPFYSFTALPVLKLRATYGYNGNTDKSVTAFTTAKTASSVSYLTRLPYATVLNPPNPQLRWERIKILNLGFDFESRNGAISGSLEYYTKKGLDLIGYGPVAPSTGFSVFKGNKADTKGRGVDITLNTRNIDKTFKWQSNFLFSYALNKVVNYKVKENVSEYLTFGDGQAILPMDGHPLFALYSYRWAGLDPANGNPQGYLDGKISEDYRQIINTITPEELVYNGPARPPFFGAFRNTFSWKRFSLSFKFIYRLGYYFRRNSVNYGSILQGLGGHSDYNKRWKRPGDENTTYIPSQPDKNNAYRDEFYRYSEILVEKGDHIRLQDAIIRYTFRETNFKNSFRNLQLYLYADNIGIIWKANKTGRDPDNLLLKPPFRISFGLKADL